MSSSFFLPLHLGIFWTPNLHASLLSISEPLEKRMAGVMCWSCIFASSDGSRAVMSRSEGSWLLRSLLDENHRDANSQLFI